jgi:phosphoribosylamine--glycine ligase
VAGLQAEGISYYGFIFFGLIEVNGEPFVIEYNCRMGDPETEVVMPRLENDLVELLLAMHQGRLAETEVRHSPQAAATVMLVSEGYPGAYPKGLPMSGLDTADDSLLFHAGTTRKDDQVVTSGGRVLAITSLAPDLQQALQRSYRHAGRISYSGKYFRRDIGWEFLNK